MIEPRFQIQIQDDGTRTVHDSWEKGREIYRTIITGPAADIVAREMVRYFTRFRGGTICST